MKKERFVEQLNNYSTEKNQLAESITELTKGLSNNKVQWRDKETGQIITSTSSKTRKVLQTQLNDFKIQRDKVSLKIESLTDSVTKLDLQVLDINSNSELTAEVGPLKYISNVTKLPMDNIVNYFVLAFIFVFDPLAVLLLISANRAFELRDESDGQDGEIEEDGQPLINVDQEEWDSEPNEEMIDNSEEELRENIYQEKPQKKDNSKRRNAYWT